MQFSSKFFVAFETFVTRGKIVLLIYTKVLHLHDCVVKQENTLRPKVCPGKNLQSTQKYSFGLQNVGIIGTC